MTFPMAFFLASALSMPTPSSPPGRWVTDTDYPKSARERKEAGTVNFEIVISPSGRVIQCSITQSTGSAELDQMTCYLLYARATFEPASDESRNPISGMYRGKLTWLLPGQKRLPPPPPLNRPPDIELEVEKLYNGAREARVGIFARIDDKGQVAYCEPLDDDPETVKLATIACGQAKALTPAPIRDADGKPIPMVRTFSVRFQASSL